MVFWNSVLIMPCLLRVFLLVCKISFEDLDVQIPQVPRLNYYFGIPFLKKFSHNLLDCKLLLLPILVPDRLDRTHALIELCELSLLAQQLVLIGLPHQAT